MNTLTIEIQRSGGPDRISFAGIPVRSTLEEALETTGAALIKWRICSFMGQGPWHTSTIAQFKSGVQS